MTDDFGKNQMPPELAAQLLEQEPEGISEDVIEEFFEILIEECAETIQRVTKIQRFGYNSTNPWTGVNNLDGLHDEFGDIIAAFEVLNILGITRFEPVRDRVAEKLRAFAVEEDPARPRIRHMSEELRKRILARAKKFED